MKFLLTTLYLLTMNVTLAWADCHHAEVHIENHKFVPESLELPTGQKIKLKIVNKDDTVEEFESHDLKREKIVPAKGSTVVSIGPLKPGKYHFFGEFHESTAQGNIIIK